MSPNYLKCKREKQLAKSRAGVMARERNRSAMAATDPGWRRVATMMLIVEAAPDGRHVAIHAHGQRDWHRCGSDRAVRVALAKMLWGTKQKGAVTE